MKEKETKGRKALLVIAVAVVITTTLVGCGPMPDRDQYLQTREAAYKAEQTATAEHLFFKAQFDGHSYIVYEHFGHKSGGPSILHDPDCPCQKGGVR